MAASCIYDVFLSFCGVDTRNKFTGHLLAALDRHGFYTFRDDTKLKRGEEIVHGLLKAIEESRVFVIVFSENYASSRWCLDELVKIMDCKRTLNQIVIPIFYDVQPSSTFIDTVVGEVANKLNPTCLNVAEYPVGIQHRDQELSELFELESNRDVRILAISGIGGIGKTTIAKAIYNRIHRHREFESCSFLANVGRTSMQPNSLVELQEKLLFDLLMDGNQRIRSADHGIEVIKRRAWCRKVLLVLDDVNNICQLRALAINRDLLRRGSRIIVTTRDLSSISSLRVDKEYMPKELNNKESLKLFSWHAFRRGGPEEGYEILSEEVVSCAKGLPLDRDLPKWKSELKKLKTIPHHGVQGKLMLSFDSLDDEQKGLFLYIACFFDGMDQDLSIKILEGCGFFPECGIGVLSCACLVSIDEFNHLVMHEEPGERSRLWYHEDILDVLKNNTVIAYLVTVKMS